MIPNVWRVSCWLGGMYSTPQYVPTPQTACTVYEKKPLAEIRSPYNNNSRGLWCIKCEFIIRKKRNSNHFFYLLICTMYNWMEIVPFNMQWYCTCPAYDHDIIIIRWLGWGWGCSSSKKRIILLIKSPANRQADTLTHSLTLHSTIVSYVSAQLK